MASIKIYSITTTSAKAYLKDLDLTYWGNYGTENLPRHYKYTITINGVSKTVKPDLDNEGETTVATFSNLSAGTTYTATAIVNYLTGGGYDLTSELTETFTTDEDTSNKPSTFSWDTPKTSGGPFNITATEWNNFTSKINEELKYLGKTEYSFTKAVKGESFTASMYNEAVNAIKSMGGGAGGYIYTVNKGDNITEYAVNQIVAELNSAINNL